MFPVKMNGYLTCECRAENSRNNAVGNEWTINKKKTVWIIHQGIIGYPGKVCVMIDE